MKVKEHWSKYYLSSLSENPNTAFFLDFFKKYKMEISEPILDIGCGEGNILKILSNSYSDILGIDFSNSAINLVKKTEPTLKNKLVEGNFNDLENLLSKKYALAILSMSLHHQDYNSSKNLLLNLDNYLTNNALIYILTRSNKTISSEKLISKETYFMPKLNRGRVHFSKQGLENIVPQKWNILELKEVEYMGRNAPISSLFLVARKRDYAF